MELETACRVWVESLYFWTDFWEDLGHSLFVVSEDC
jgi:hypothetical protein